MNNPQYYPNYLELDKLLDAQHPVSFTNGHEPAHDEMLFIIVHQAYELWFKQILFEVESIISIMQQPAVNDNSPALQTVVHRLGRVNTILKLLVQQIDVMETMTAMDFLDFRDLLRPASGFQSWQFKVLEARLGLQYSQRHGQQYYVSVLQPAYAEMIKKAESAPTLLQLMAKWLERIPFFDEKALWENFETTYTNTTNNKDFWQEYRHRLIQSLSVTEAENLFAFDTIINGLENKFEEPLSSLSTSANRAALFIMLYRGYPMLQLPYQFINTVLETDDLLSTWRYRHMNMVHRMIGHRVGTGGSTGKNYLKGAADKHYIFKDFALLTSFLIERKLLPQLSKEMEQRLGFV
jgi:tryptophan 2,3-dioxygenase